MWTAFNSTLYDRDHFEHARANSGVNTSQWALETTGRQTLDYYRTHKEMYKIHFLLCALSLFCTYLSGILHYIHSCWSILAPATWTSPFFLCSIARASLKYSRRVWSRGQHCGGRHAFGLTGTSPTRPWRNLHPVALAIANLLRNYEVTPMPTRTVPPL